MLQSKIGGLETRPRYSFTRYMKKDCGLLWMKDRSFPAHKFLLREEKCFSVREYSLIAAGALPRGRVRAEPREKTLVAAPANAGD
jgi:hypothetical protein